MRSWLAPGLLLVLLILTTERPAYGYVDPGSGALIWQGLVAAALGVGFHFRRFFHRFSRKK